MAIIVNNVRATLTRGEQDIIDKAIAKIKCSRKDVVNSYVMKSSVDARHRNNLCLVSSVGIELRGGEKELVEKLNDPTVRLREKAEYNPTFGSEKLNSRPVIVGFGPCGMFAGLMLAKYGYRPIVVERGSSVDARVDAVTKFFETGELNTKTNVQFGEGGAGTFSDGKLTTRIGDARCETVIDEFIKNGAPEKIKHMAKPHIGTDNLRTVVKNIRKRIIELGGEVLFDTQLDGIDVRGNRVEGVSLNGEETKTDAVILAIGHSARDTFSMIHEKGFFLEPKPFSVGVRIEHLQSEIDKALYGDYAGNPALPHGEYQLSHRENGRAVYTFCMCPGGSVVAAASEDGGTVTNGMSLYSRNGRNANSAMVVSVTPEDFGNTPLAGVEFQRKLERAAFNDGQNFKAPCQTVGNFQKGKAKISIARVEPTYPCGVIPCDFNKLFPKFISEMLHKGLYVFDRKLKGFAAEDSVMTGVETRTSSPLRITRGETLEAQGFEGLYPAGEGAGYAGGIMSAAVDGMRAAEAVMAKYKPFD